MLSDLLIITATASLGVLAAWRSGLLSVPFTLAGAGTERGREWLTADGEAAWASLVRKLHYRDFYDDTVECAGGWLWAGLETLPPASDGLSNYDLNRLATQYDTMVVGLPMGIRLQTLTSVTRTSQPARECYRRLASNCPDEVWRTLLQARGANFLDERGRDIRQYLFIGVQAPGRSVARARLRGLWNPIEWVEQSAEEFRAERRRVLEARDHVRRFWKTSGGRTRPLSGAEMFTLTWSRLNRGQHTAGVAPPAYTAHCSPREVLAGETIEVDGSDLVCGPVRVRTLSLARLPEEHIVRSLEQLTRSPEINFPFEVSSHLLTLNQYDEDERLERAEHYAAAGIEQARRINRDEIKQATEIGEIREATRAGRERIIEVGFAVTIEGASTQELDGRASAVRGELRKVFGFEVTADRHAALATRLATLPCHSTKDIRRRRALSRDGAALAGWTGGPRGLDAHQATIVFERRDGGLYFFDPASARFNSGLFLTCGATGSGKSALMALLAFHHLAAGRRGVILDVNGSYHRLAVASHSPRAHVDITDPRRVAELGVFEGGEDRLAEVCALLEQLALDPVRSEPALAPQLRAQLHQIAARAYRHAVSSAPRMDDFIRAARLSAGSPEQVSRGQELADRWAVYASTGPLGAYFNSSGAADQRTGLLDLPLVVFDFRGARADARLQHVATLLVGQHLARFGERRGDKFFFADELAELARLPLLAAAIDSCVNMARKQGTHVGVGSQHPMHFERPDLKGIVINCETKWLFPMPSEIAARAFDLAPGERALLATLRAGGRDGREVLLLSPLGAAHLVVRLSAAEMRLLAAATTGEHEDVTVSDAEGSVGVPSRLKQAFVADRLGRADEFIEEVA